MPYLEDFLLEAIKFAAFVFACGSLMRFRFNSKITGLAAAGALLAILVLQAGLLLAGLDETLVLTAIDLGGRPYFVFDGEFPTEKIGDMAAEMVREFFYAVSYSAGMNLHMKVLNGGNSHHMAEALFKSFAKSLDEAVSYDPRIAGVLSTKGNL